MKMAKPLLVLPAIAILALELALVGVAVQPAQHTGFAQLYIYKNGKLIYYDPDDPPVNNFAYMIASYITGGHDYNPFTIYDIDGNTHSYIPTSGTAYIWFINTSLNFDPATYTIPDYDYFAISIDKTSFLADEQSFQVTASASYTDTIGKTVSIYGTAFVCCNVLYFVDLYDNTITLNPNDTLTVIYTFNVGGR